MLTNKNGGKLFNTWPLMDGHFLPEKVENETENKETGTKKDCGCVRDIGM